MILFAAPPVRRAVDRPSGSRPSTYDSRSAGRSARASQRVDHAFGPTVTRSFAPSVERVVRPVLRRDARSRGCRGGRPVVDDSLTTIGDITAPLARIDVLLPPGA